MNTHITQLSRRLAPYPFDELRLGHSWQNSRALAANIRRNNTLGAINLTLRIFAVFVVVWWLTLLYLHFT